MLGGGGLSFSTAAGVSPGSNGLDVAVSADGTKVYSASGAPYDFPVFDALTLQSVGSLPGVPYPNNVEVAWNGVVAAGANAYYDPTDIWIYGPSGVALGSYHCN